MALPKQPKPIYTDDYYRLEKLVSDPAFKAKVDALFTLYKEEGCPIPDKLFKTYQEYEAWLKVFWERHKAAEQQEWMDEFITPGQFLEDRLREAGLDHKNSKYKEFLTFHVFLGRPYLLERAFNLRWIRNRKTGTPELFIQLLPHTKKEHIEARWGDIVREMERLPDYMGKSKPWVNFERDLEIFQTYQSVKEERERSGKKSNSRWKKDQGVQPLDYEVLSYLGEKYPNLKLGDIRKAVSRVAKLDAPPKEDV